MQKQESSHFSARNSSSGTSCSSSSSGSFPEAVSGSPSPTESSDRYKTELCRSFEEGGTCRYGNKCRFAHGRWEMRSLDRHPKYKTEFCRTYHSSGFCPYGQRCHFIHGDQGSPRLDSAPSAADLHKVVNGCDERRNLFGEGGGGVGSTVAAFEARGNRADLHAPSCAGQVDVFQGLRQQQERRLRTIGEGRECDSEGKLVRLKQKLDAENRMRFFEVERRGDERMKERFQHHHGSSSSSSSGRLEPKLLELELSAILQRRRSQLRCDSVGSGCETPPPAAAAAAVLAAALDSRTSSPLSSSADETRSPPYSAFNLQDVIALPRSPLVRHHNVLSSNNPSPVNRFAMRASAAAAAAATVSNISRHKDSLPSALWPCGDGQNPSRSVSGSDSPPHRLQLRSSSSSLGRRPSSGLYFVFDAETLARLIRR